MPVQHDAVPSGSGMRARALELQRRSRELRLKSAAVLLRRDAAVHRLELRREVLRSRFVQLRTPLRAAGSHTDDDGMQDWLRGEVLEMIAGGWSRRELADVGIGTDLLRELRLDGHSGLGPAAADPARERAPSARGASVRPPASTPRPGRAFCAASGTS